MSNANDPAFPTENDTKWFHGITVRELFAAMAMQAIVAKKPLETVTDRGVDEDDIHVARGAIAYADALLAELNKP